MLQNLKMMPLFATIVLFQLRFFDNAAVGHVTDIPTVLFLNKMFLAARTVSS